MDVVEESLAMLAERTGDPAALIYARLFQHYPETEALFALDHGGHVRGQMLAVAFETLLDGGERLSGIVGIERMNHVNIGVPQDAFDRFFVLLMDTVRDVLGSRWTPQMETAWQARLQSIGVLERYAARM